MLQSHDTPFYFTRGKEFNRHAKLKPKHYFTGSCYRCSCSRHLHALCPLRTCTICFNFGHAEHLCSNVNTR